MEKRYEALRIIGTIYKILGVIAAILTLLAVLGFCASVLLGGSLMGNLPRQPGVGPALAPFLGTVGGIIGALLSLLWGGVIAVSLFALGDFIYLLLAIEENTRASALMLRAQNAPPPAPR